MPSPPALSIDGERGPERPAESIRVLDRAVAAE
jgi:hypothetical protein